MLECFGESIEGEKQEADIIFYRGTMTRTAGMLEVNAGGSVFDQRAVDVISTSLRCALGTKGQREFIMLVPVDGMIASAKERLRL